MVEDRNMQEYMITKENGEKLIIESSEPDTGHTERDRLYDYYRSYYTSTHDRITDDADKTLKRIAYSLSESDARDKNLQISNAQAAQFARISAYADRLYTIKEIMDPVEELVEAYEDYDFDNEVTIEINGNCYTYDPDKTDIETIRDKLDMIGEHGKGNHWYVTIDANGEVLLQW